MVGDHLVKTWSKTQACVTLSAGEAELVALVKKAATEVIGMKLTGELGEGATATDLVLTVAAAESAIGLCILVVYFRNRGSIAVEDVNVMKG